MEIFVPLSPSGGLRGDDTELRYTLRTIAAHWKTDAVRVTLLGRRPEWAKRVRHVEARTLRDATTKAAELAGTGEFVWWMDDCLLLRDTGMDDIRNPRHAGDLLRDVDRNRHRGFWRRHLAEVADELVATGRTTLNFSYPHTPTVFTGTDYAAALAHWGARWKHKLPIESWINNDGRPHQDTLDWETRFQPETTFRPPAGKLRFLIHYEMSFAPLIPWLTTRFSTPSPWEKTGQTNIPPCSFQVFE